jgi:hypothetical protein
MELAIALTISAVGCLFASWWGTSLRKRFNPATLEAMMIIPKTDKYRPMTGVTRMTRGSVLHGRRYFVAGIVFSSAALISWIFILIRVVFS